MKKVTLFCFLFFISITGLGAQQVQDLYIPRNVKQAYENGTRSKDGTPGPNYWENHGVYSIDMRINPPDRTIHGSEEITYYNNSPDTLKSLVFRLFMNRHKPGAARNRQTSERAMNSGIHIEKYVENGTVKQWDSSNDATAEARQLSEPLAPGDSVHLAIDWSYPLVERAGREGVIDSTTYFMAYFYPRVAVYDDYIGWDRIPFTGSHEFYSDSNDYTVDITIPKNYIVWGTGTLKNAKKVLQDDVYKRFQKSMTSEETVPVANLEQVKNGEVTAQNEQNTWTFHAENVPDMAFGMSNHFVWDAASVVVDEESNRRASVQAAYNDTSADYHQMVQYGRHALGWFSKNWPGVSYPYEKTTEFQGGAGMEYPMMANDASYPSPVFARFVAEHEIAHTYFPFYMGVNESRYAFMDEGWATTLELLIGREDLGRERADQMFRQFRIARWIHNPSTLSDIPIITPADQLTGAYGNNAYGKAALGYLAMKDLLGDAQFKKCLHGYMNRWHAKHPTPWDFFFSFNDISGQNLNWFWKSWYFDNSYIDIGLKGVENNEYGYRLTLENIGGMPAPVDMKVTYSDGKTDMMHQSPEIWKENIDEATVKLNTDKDIQSIELNGGIWMDADTTNNSWHK